MNVISQLAGYFFMKNSLAFIECRFSCPILEQNIKKRGKKARGKNLQFKFKTLEPTKINSEIFGAICTRLT